MLIITTCTNKKRSPPPASLEAASLPHVPANDLAALWAGRLAEAEPRVEACALYCGSGFQTAAQVAYQLHAPLFIVSAGLGLISAKERVPPYACTVLPGVADSILARAAEPLTPAGWWTLLQISSPFSRSIEAVAAGETGLILAALSDTYLEMLSGDLMRLDPAVLARVRIFTRTPLSRVPSDLKLNVMPYDDRLEGDDSGRKGPRSYFAGRALRHFVECVMEPNDVRSVAEHAAAVHSAIVKWRWPEKIERRRVDDAEMLELIRLHWQAAGAGGGRMLRYLRDELRVACEQTRCKELVARYRQESAA